MPATPVRVPRRPRLSQSDDISHLTLPEVRDRLARNERVLHSALFSTSPTAGLSSPFARSPGAGSPPFGANGNGAAGMGGFGGAMNGNAGSSTTTPISPDDDPVRSRLLAVREALRAREAELLAGSIGSMSLEAPVATSPPTRGGKARALEAIRLTEAGQARPSICLPIQQTIDLGTRDFDNQTAARLANMNLSGPTARQQRRHIDDELGRAASAAQYARAHVDDDDDDDMFDTDEAYAAATVYAADRQDAGNGLPLTTAKARRAEGFDEDMEPSDDEDDNEFAEGNDEYEGDGRGTMDAAPGR